MATFSISKYNLSLFQILLVVVLSRVSAFFQSAMTCRQISLLFANLALVVVLYYRLADTLKLHNFTVDTFVYLLVLLFAFGIQYCYNTYAYLQGIPLYEQTALRLWYRACRPIYMTFKGQLPPIYYSLTILHGAATFLLTSFVKQADSNPSLVYFAIPVAIVEGILLEELETAFVYTLLLPDLFYFIEYTFNLFFNLLYLIYRFHNGESIELPKLKRLELTYVIGYILAELLIMIISTRTCQTRFTETKENKLIAFDSTIENSVDAFITLLVNGIPLFAYILAGSAILPYYPDRPQQMLSETQHLFRTMNGYMLRTGICAMLCLVHSILYTIQFTYNSII